MGNKDNHLSQPCQKDPEPGAGSRKPYIKPALIKLGCITEVTLGLSAGSGESGGAGTRKSETAEF